MDAKKYELIRVPQKNLIEIILYEKDEKEMVSMRVDEAEEAAKRMLRLVQSTKFEGDRYLRRTAEKFALDLLKAVLKIRIERARAK